MADRYLYGSISSPSAGELTRVRLAESDRALLGGLVRGSASVDLGSGGAVELTGVATSKFLVDNSGSNLELGVAGGGAQKVEIFSEGTGADSIKLGTSAGIDVGSGLTTSFSYNNTEGAGELLVKRNNVTLLTFNQSGGVTFDLPLSQDFDVTVSNGGAMNFNSGSGTILLASASGTVDIDAGANFDVDVDGWIGLDTSGTGTILLRTVDGLVKLHAGTDASSVANVELDAGGSILLDYRANDTGTEEFTVSRNGTGVLTCSSTGSVAAYPVSGQDLILNPSGGGDCDIQIGVGGGAFKISGSDAFALVTLGGSTTWNYGGSSGSFSLQRASGNIFAITTAGQVDITPVSGQDLNQTTAGAGSITLTSGDDFSVDANDDLTLTYDSGDSTGDFSVVRNSNTILSGDHAGTLKIQRRIVFPRDGTELATYLNSTSNYTVILDPSFTYSLTHTSVLQVRGNTRVMGSTRFGSTATVTISLDTNNANNYLEVTDQVIFENVRFASSAWDSTTSSPPYAIKFSSGAQGSMVSNCTFAANLRVNPAATDCCLLFLDDVEDLTIANNKGIQCSANWFVRGDHTVGRCSNIDILNNQVDSYPTNNSSAGAGIFIPQDSYRWLITGNYLRADTGGDVDDGCCVYIESDSGLDCGRHLIEGNHLERVSNSGVNTAPLVYVGQPDVTINGNYLHGRRIGFETTGTPTEGLVEVYAPRCGIVGNEFALYNTSRVGVLVYYIDANSDELKGTVVNSNRFTGIHGTATSDGHGIYLLESGADPATYAIGGSANGNFFDGDDKRYCHGLTAETGTNGKPELWSVVGNSMYQDSGSNDGMSETATSSQWGTSSVVANHATQS